MVPTLLGSGNQQKHDILYWEFFEGGGKRAIRQGKWKMILFNTNQDAQPKVELYDLEKDVSETNEVSKQFPEIVSELKKQMDKAHSPSEHQNFRLASELTAKELESQKTRKGKKKKK
jgi:arylsulfatase A